MTKLGEVPGTAASEPPHGVCSRPPELIEPFITETMEQCGLPAWRPTAELELEECQTLSVVPRQRQKILTKFHKNFDKIESR